MRRTAIVWLLLALATASCGEERAKPAPTANDYVVLTGPMKPRRAEELIEKLKVSGIQAGDVTSLGIAVVVVSRSERPKAERVLREAGLGELVIPEFENR